MPTMTVATEVEATPEAVEEHLRKYAAALSTTGSFPVAAGSMVDFKPEAAKALGALPDTKALVVETFTFTPIALLAYVKAAGGIMHVVCMASQIVVPAPPAPPAG